MNLNPKVYAYDPFGDTLSKSGDLSDENPFRFSTKYWDNESGLYYYGYRYYGPELARWLNRDPIEENGGNSLYAFAGNDSINIYDALGLKGIAEGATYELDIVGQSIKPGECGAFAYPRIIKVTKSAEALRIQGTVVQKMWFYVTWTDCGSVSDNYEKYYLEVFPVEGPFRREVKDTWGFGSQGRCTKGSGMIAGTASYYQRYTPSEPPWKRGEEGHPGGKGKLLIDLPFPGSKEPEPQTDLPSQPSAEPFTEILYFEWDCCDAENTTIVSTM